MDIALATWYNPTLRVKPGLLKGRPLDQILHKIYRRLYFRYGAQKWWPADSPIEIILGAILTQATSWTNAERALDNLKTARLVSLPALKYIDIATLAKLVVPSVYFNAKAKKIKAFVDYVWEKYGGELDSFLSISLDKLRNGLLTIYGIGDETADDIVLYASEQPSFVIDSYTRRILRRLRIRPSKETYLEYQQVFHQGLPRDVELFKEYHALFDVHAKYTCRKIPVCSNCCLSDICPTGFAEIDTNVT